MITNVDKSNEADTARDLKNEKVRRVVMLVLQSAVLLLQAFVFTETVFLLFSGKAYYIGSGWTDESNILHATVYVLILYAVCEAAALIETGYDFFFKTSIKALRIADFILTLICISVFVMYAYGLITATVVPLTLYSVLFALRIIILVQNIISLKRLRPRGSDAAE